MPIVLIVLDVRIRQMRHTWSVCGTTYPQIWRTHSSSDHCPLCARCGGCIGQSASDVVKVRARFGCGVGNLVTYVIWLAPSAAAVNAAP